MDAISYANVSVKLATGLASPLLASDRTVQVFFEFNSTAPLVFSQQAGMSLQGTQIVEVRCHMHATQQTFCTVMRDHCKGV
jgi:hypothetical protein